MQVTVRWCDWCGDRRDPGRVEMLDGGSILRSLDLCAPCRDAWREPTLDAAVKRFRPMTAPNAVLDEEESCK